jgi:4'-phosphopantetheinyl transferase
MTVAHIRIPLANVGRQTGTMDVYWLERSAADLPAQSDWLSASDRTRLDGMRFAKRRDDWRLGRWTAKLAVAAYLKLPTDFQALAEIEVLPAPSGAPEVFFANQPAEVTISLSHRDGTAICAIAGSGVSLGCDLEIVEPRSDAFVTDYFTPEEQALVARAHPADRFLLLALLWSAKESALKALRAGLRLDTRSVVVNLVDGFQFPSKDLPRSREDSCDSALIVQPACGVWRPLHVRFSADQLFQGWWQHEQNLLRTLVATPSPSQPISLNLQQSVLILGERILPPSPKLFNQRSLP